MKTEENVPVDTSGKIDKKELDSNIDNFFKGTSNNLQSGTKLYTPINEKEKKNLMEGRSVKFSANLISEENKKRQSSKPRGVYKKPETEYVGRENKVDSDLYFKTKDENENLKKHQLALNAQIKH